MARSPESYNKNGIPFPWTGVLNQDKHVAVRESPNRPNFHQDKATIEQARSGAGALRAPNQPAPQTFSKEGPLGPSPRMNNGINTTEAGNSGLLSGSIEVAKTVTTNPTEKTNTEHKFQWKKISRSARKRYHMLKEEGIPQEEARKLCKIDRSTLEHMRFLNPQKRNNSEAPQGPLNKILNTSTEIEKQNSLSTNDIITLRVGITNSQHMSEDQMRMLRQHLITAIKEKCSDGCGPVFLGFSHKPGWVLVTCANQRSKDWLVHEVSHLEPWPGAQLSIIPDQELPKPPRAVTLIPDSEGVSVEEALKLFKVQNSGLNTGLWKVRFQKVEKEGKTVYFTIDDASADVLRAQNCEASIGFETVTFKINGQYRVYTPRSTQNQVPATQGRSSKPLSQSLNGKSFDQSKEAKVTNKVGPYLAARSQLPQAAGRDQVQPIQHQDFQPPAKKNRFAKGSGDITSWEKPAAVGQSFSQTKGVTRPITQNSQGHGKPPLIQPNLGGPVLKESTSARGLAPQATSTAVQQINQESQGHGKTPLIQPSLGRPVIREPSFSAKGLPPQVTTRAANQNNRNTRDIIQDSQCGRNPTMGRAASASAFANRGKSSQRVSPSHGGSFDRNRANGTVYLVKSSQATTEGTYQAKNTSSSHVGAFALNKGVTARELTPGGFGARPIIQNPLSKRTSFTQSREGLTESGHDGFSALDKGKLSQAGIPPIIGRTLVQNEEGTATVSNLDGFSGQSQARSGFGDHPIIRDSLCGKTMRHDRSGVTNRTSDQGSALTTNQVPRSQVGAQIIQDPSHGNQAFDQGRKVTKIDLTVTDSEEAPSRDMSPETGGGYHSWIIEDLESYTARLTQGNSGTGTPNSAREMTSVCKLSPQGRDSCGARIIGSESHGRPVYGCRLMTGQSRPEKLLPHPSGSGSFEPRTIEPESHGRPFHGSRTMTDRDSRLDKGMLPHQSDSFEPQTIELECYGRPAHGSRTMTGKSRPEGPLSHPSGNFGSRTIELESHGSPVYSSRTMTGRGKGLLPHPSGSLESRTIEPESHGRPVYSSRTITGRDKGLLPHPSGSFESRTIEPESHGRPLQESRVLTDRESMPGGLPHQNSFEIERESRGKPSQDSMAMVTDRRSMSNRRLPPQGRGSSGDRIQDPVPRGRLFQSSQGRYSKSNKRLSPLARDSYGDRIQDPETYGRLQGSKGTLTDRGSRADRRLSPQARDSYGGRQDPETHERPFQGSKRSLTGRDSISDKLSALARGYSA